MRQADRNILKRVEGRLRNEHCGVKYKIITGNHDCKLNVTKIWFIHTLS